ncbi:N-formylglutamate amidohydrolase [Qipengyuania sp.]|uniref:N-formylglutamate amidohydrolase n=1 Tax=Qipengyuania sp. TaxID=2004515 RepID=UPI0037370A66
MNTHSDPAGTRCPDHREGGSIPGGGGAALVLSGPRPSALPVLIGVPHAGRSYPEELCETMRGGEGTRLRLEDRYADLLGQEIARLTGAGILMAQAPRAMIDLNRASDDIDWSMVSGQQGRRAVPHSLANRRARSGLGLVPRRLPGLGEIWKHPIAADELEKRIAAIHRPYHQALGAELAHLRDRWGAALLLDFHSMPPLSPRYTGEEVAEIVIGDRFGLSCDPLLSAAALTNLARGGRRVAHNRPYSGGYILERHAAPARNIHAIQIEVCRSLYLDARLDQPSARLPVLARALGDMVMALARQILDLRHGDPFPVAAE